MQTKIEFHGKGGELFLKMLLGGFLTAITLGIYAPWFMADMNRYLYSKTTLAGRDYPVHPRFAGAGWEIFKMNLLGGFLCGITLGIYTPWFMARVCRYWAEHTEAVSESGRSYRLSFSFTGGALFGALFVGGLLSGVTLGIYLPWFMCKLARLFAESVALIDAESGEAVGQVGFEGQGGELLGMVLLNGLLCSVTLGIYTPWAMVKVMRFWAGYTRVANDGQTFALDYLGTGGQLFGRLIVNGLLCGITLGIYSSWALVDMLRFHCGKLVADAKEVAPAVKPPARAPAAQLPAAAVIAAAKPREQARVR